MKTNILPQSLISLLVLAAASAGPTALAQQTNESSEQKVLRSQTIESLNKQLAELEKAAPTTPTTGSTTLSVKAEGLARQFYNQGALAASGRAWALALKTSSDPFRQSAIFTQWSEQEVSPKHAAELKESALKVLDKEAITLAIKKDAFRNLINFYRTHNEPSKADKVQAQFAKLMGTDDPKILFRKEKICLGCGMG
jgi:DNA-binding helix-hairpin-helix protein with protein kinase domain